LGESQSYVDLVHDAGALVMQTVGSAEEARRAVGWGVDVIIAQGWEAGGHLGSGVATLPLVPAVVDAVAPVPVIAAGGIGDARGVAAVLALGAQAALLGTRFLLAEMWQAAGQPPLESRPRAGEVIAHFASGDPILRYSPAPPMVGTTGEIEALSLWAGQSVALANQSQPAAEIVDELVSRL
jgi:nitronate monooxygenase